MPAIQITFSYILEPGLVSSNIQTQLAIYSVWQRQRTGGEGGGGLGVNRQNLLPHNGEFVGEATIVRRGVGRGSREVEDLNKF